MPEARLVFLSMKCQVVLTIVLLHLSMSEEKWLIYSDNVQINNFKCFEHPCCLLLHYDMKCLCHNF